MSNLEISPPQNHLIGVVGAGQMGHGIAHVMLRAGHRSIKIPGA